MNTAYSIKNEQQITWKDPFRPVFDLLKRYKCVCQIALPADLPTKLWYRADKTLLFIIFSQKERNED